MPTSAISAAAYPGAWLSIVLPSLALNYLGQGALVIQSQGDRKSVLSDVPGLGAVPDGRARHRCHRDRQSGRDHRRLFADARRFNSVCCRDLKSGTRPTQLRPDLYSAHQPSASDRRDAAGGAVPLVKRARLRVWHCGHRHNGGYRHHGIHRVLAVMGLVAACRSRDDCFRSSFVDLTFLVRQSAQGGGRRLGAIGARRRADAHHVHLAARHRLVVRQNAQAGVAARRSRAMLERKPPQRVPGTAVFLTSDPTSAPTALMHSLKHYKVLHENNVILSVVTAHDAPRRSVGSASAWSRSAPPSCACCCASAIWKRRMCPGRSRSRASSAGNSTSCRRRSSCRGER